MSTHTIPVVSPPPPPNNPTYESMSTLLKQYFTTLPGALRIPEMVISFLGFIASILSYPYAYERLVNFACLSGVATALLNLCIHLYQYIYSKQRGLLLVMSPIGQIINLCIYTFFTILFAASGIICATHLRHFDRALRAAMVFVFIGAALFFTHAAYHFYTWRLSVKAYNARQAGTQPSTEFTNPMPAQAPDAKPSDDALIRA